MKPSPLSDRSEPDFEKTLEDMLERSILPPEVVTGDDVASHADTDIDRAIQALRDLFDPKSPPSH
jgi:hypothetical protein